MTRPTIDPANLAAALGADTGEPQAPDADKRREPELCGDLDMRIARDGTWFYHGSPIGRKKLTKLFSTILSRDEDGEYWLTTPVEKGRRRATHGLLPGVVLLAPAPCFLRPVLVRGRLEALIARAVFYQLVEIGVEETLGDETLFGVWSAGCFFPLGRLSEAA